ncbi:MAG TPA: neutral zinc metallopeptidase [Polyangiaceae bacterium]|nr:neutral zinc metallopeptidase [Polyangiaceae bacterium]
MRIEGQRRSEKFEDRGQSGGGGGGIGSQGLLQVVRLLGVKGTLIAAVVLGGVFLFAPAGLKQSLIQALTGGDAQSQSTSPSAGQGACALSKTNEQACDFSRVVLASTEDVWTQRFSEGALPGPKVGEYVKPTLVVFSNQVSTGGCGSATSGSGPFYCPADSKLYIDPTFYQVMESKLKAPGDFAQAYVIAHEVGHHVQNLIGSSRRKVAGESKNQASVRVELQADCFAGIWGHAAKSTLSITEEDLGEALTAAHAIGDDTLGHADKTQFTHGSSEQRIRWFRRGFDGGDARNCDTFAEASYARL